MTRSSPKELLSILGNGLLAGLGVLFLAAWVLTLMTTNDPEVWQRDWHCLWAAGDAFAHGQTADIYTTVYTPEYETSVCREGYFWLYPPYALYPAVILGWMSPWVAYFLTVLAIFGCLGATVWAIHRLYPSRDASLVTFCLAVFASEPVNGVIVTGQNSAWLLLAVAGGILALKHKKWWWAAVAFAVLGLKPNWVIIAVLWLAISGNWGVVWRLALMGVLMILSTAPMDWALWKEFYLSSKSYADFVLDVYPASRLITTHASVRSIGLHESPVFYPLWLALQGAVVFGLIAVWRSDRSVMAKGGLMILATVACNAYTNFYDGLLLTIPAMVWWFERERYSKTLWWLIGAAIGCSWLWLWLRTTYVSDSIISPVGFFLVVWAVGEGLASLKSRAKRPPVDHPG